MSLKTRYIFLKQNYEIWPQLIFCYSNYNVKDKMSQNLKGWGKMCERKSWMVWKILGYKMWDG